MNHGPVQPGFFFRSFRSLFLIKLILLTVIILPSFPAFAQTLSPEDLARQAKLQTELNQVEKDIEAQTALLRSKQKESASLERDISVLNYQISTAKLNIRAKQLEIQQLGSDISKKQLTIQDLGNKIDREKESLIELLKKSRDLDQTSAVEVALSTDNLSALFADVNSYHALQTAILTSFSVIRSTKQQTETAKGQLENRRDATLNAQREIEKETKKIQGLEGQKKDLLAVSKNQEKNYQQVLTSRKKRKAEILNALFALRDTKAIPFEKALAYAQEVSAKTGVRPAFLLAILTQETNLGANVGRCNRPGDPPAKSWKNIMKPERDYEPFLRIVKALGLDPDTVPLSCPQAGGYGGAMGPSQFIPSTWELYADRIASVTGHNPPSPWAAEDAFAATGLYLKDLGGGAGTYTAESRAAAKYYAGSRWATAGQSYARSVMGHAEQIQGNIDYLQGN